MSKPSKPLQYYIDRSHAQAKDKGFTKATRQVGDLLMLMVTEVSEAFESWRDGAELTDMFVEDDGKPEGVPSELADVCIRVFDFCGRYGIDLERAIQLKLDYNQTRPHLHGGKRV